MDYITVTAKTLDDAITNAQAELGVTSDKLEYVVIEKGSAGFLGIGMKQAVIKARKKEEPVVETADSIVEEVKDILNEVKMDVKKDIKKDVKKEFKKEEKAEKKFEKKEHSNREKSNKKDKNFKKEKHAKKQHEESVKPVEVKAAEPVKEEIKLVPVEEVTKVAVKNFITDVLEAMDMKDVEIKVSVDEEGALCINMDGPNMGIMIGKRGQTLDSLQYLANRVANKSQEGYVRVKLDTENYRNRRKKTLENLAKNIAGKVKRSRRAVALEPMNPYERRIIHSALQADSAVSTHSEGEEPYRKVVVTYNRR